MIRAALTEGASTRHPVGVVDEGQGRRHEAPDVTHAGLRTTVEVLRREFQHLAWI